MVPHAPLALRGAARPSVRLDQGAARDRAAAAFGEGFYGGLRALNYEDIDDFAGTCEREHEEARRERERERERRAAQAQAQAEAGP
jgi:hypothetical protein